MLTSKQCHLLLFIQRCLKEAGVPPSYEEMRKALDLRSKSGVHRLVIALEERGFVRRLRNRARAIEVLRLPDEMAAKQERANAASLSLSQAPLSQAPLSQASNVVTLPLYGKIAAGAPIDALRDNSDKIGIPAAILGRGEHYALEVSGDSMIEAGILSGDIALIRRCDTAENGTIVVAFVDGQEVTLKRLRRKGASIALEPANKTIETRIFRSDQVKIQGCLVGLYRRY